MAGLVAAGVQCAGDGRGAWPSIPAASGPGARTVPLGPSLLLQGMLVESEKREMGGDIACLDVAPVPEGRQRCRFLAVGMFDGTVRVLSLDPDSTLKVLATQVRGRGAACEVHSSRRLGCGMALHAALQCS